ncbi:M48 family metalloprotease [Chelativorans sp. AA-79]|uniref:M48 family metalloprotease n=1 Tax=Chelativorans sp. AA-79 TaxID=3028735 RepID=UPI0023F67963|nr:M48 family metalloprotease [Chelativorans sp. AA-79]WEX07081.1 M48 family metalloprotease [Chelativorans sp. AA-79]
MVTLLELATARLSRILAAILVAAHMLVSAVPAFAQRSVPIVRDAEIEALVADYAGPILEAAGLSGSGIEIVLVNDHRFNAFVAGRRIFIHTGALLTSETPNEIIGVIAHEVGHLAGGHQHRLRDQLARAQTMAVVAALLGIGAGVAAAASNQGDLAGAGVGLAMGGSEAARRSLLGYQRTEEATADRSAIEYLERTGQSGRGMLVTFQRMAGDMALAGVNVDPYQFSHPMPHDRIANLEELVKRSRFYDRKDPPVLQLRHDLARAKIAAYTAGQNAVARVFRKDPGGLPTFYADAINTYLHGNPRSALAKVDKLIASQPQNPYFHELKGEVLIKANRPREAAEAYGAAIKLAPPSGLLQVGHGQALLATGQPDLVRRAASELETGLTREPEYVNGYRFLAQAYGQLGEIGPAELATAEGHFHAGAYRDAKIFATRAQMKLKRGSPEWVRAQDIIEFHEPGKK